MTHRTPLVNRRGQSAAHTQSLPVLRLVTLLGLSAAMVVAVVVTVATVLAPAAARAERNAPPVPADVQLRAGESAELDAGALQVSLVQLEEDSRCPMNVMCVWQGRSVVRLHATVDGIDRGELTATLFPGRAPQQASDRDAVVDRYVISVADVQPYPNTGQSQPLDQKVVTLHVELVTP